MYEEFDKLYPELSYLGIAYTETSDGKHSISFELNLKETTWSQYLDEDILVVSGNFMESGLTEDEVFQEMIKDINFMGLNEMIFLDEDKVWLATGLEMHDEGLYDPLAKDMDNDGIPDRYDHDFRDSDYLASTFDIEVNEKSEKPSIIEQIQNYQSNSECCEQENKESERER